MCRFVAMFEHPVPEDQRLGGTMDAFAQSDDLRVTNHPLQRLQILRRSVEIRIAHRVQGFPGPLHDSGSCILRCLYADWGGSYQ
jgi:hypothetical protein